MDHSRGVGLNPRPQFQAIRNRLRMDGRDLDGGFLRCVCAADRRLVLAAKAHEKQKSRGRKCDRGRDPGCMAPVSGHGCMAHGSISDAAT